VGQFGFVIPSEPLLRARDPGVLIRADARKAGFLIQTDPSRYGVNERGLSGQPILIAMALYHGATN